MSSLVCVVAVRDTVSGAVPVLGLALRVAENPEPPPPPDWAEQESVVPPPDPAQVQVHGLALVPLPETELGEPAVHMPEPEGLED